MMRAVDAEMGGALCAVFITLAFLAFPLRRNVFLSAYALAWGVVFGSYALWTFHEPGAADERGAAEWWVMTAGLWLYGFGLFAVRVILRRSVSLRLLSEVAGGAATGDDIAYRLVDLRAYGMVRRRHDRYELTPLGRLVAVLMGPLYALEERTP